ncbi:hypothetical protein PspLS_06681 [Pyricularia sp. CBS 133598]|nr:hypothetical protein PspLS_06681 [Pyricularia sp. CBS 133598]
MYGKASVAEIPVAHRPCAFLTSGKIMLLGSVQSVVPPSVIPSEGAVVPVQGTNQAPWLLSREVVQRSPTINDEPWQVICTETLSGVVHQDLVQHYGVEVIVRFSPARTLKLLDWSRRPRSDDLDLRWNSSKGYEGLRLVPMQCKTEDRLSGLLADRDGNGIIGVLRRQPGETSKPKT